MSNHIQHFRDKRWDHTWNEQGTYNIEAKVMEVIGEESDWGYFEVTVPRNKSTNNDVLLWSLLERFPVLQQFIQVLMS